MYRSIKPVKKPVVVAYPKPAPLKEYPPPLPPPTTPKPEYRHFPKRTAQHYPVHPAIGRKVVTKVEEEEEGKKISHCLLVGQ